MRENLWMFAQFYGLSSADANTRIVELLDMAAAMFRRCDNIARERGLIDRTTNY